MSRHIELDPAALRDYEQLPSADQARVRDVLGALLLAGIPADSEPAPEVDGAWRIPVGRDLVLLVLVAEGDLYVSAIIPRTWLL